MVPTNSIINRFSRSACEGSQEVQNDILPQGIRHPIQHEQYKYRPKFGFRPVRPLTRRVRAVVISSTDDLPDPSGHERDTHNGKSNEGSIAALQVLVVQDFWNLEDDGDEGEETSRPQAVVVGVDGAAVDEEAFCG